MKKIFFLQNSLLSAKTTISGEITLLDSVAYSIAGTVDLLKETEKTGGSDLIGSTDLLENMANLDEEPGIRPTGLSDNIKLIGTTVVASSTIFGNRYEIVLPGSFAVDPNATYLLEAKDTGYTQVSAGGVLLRGGHEISMEAGKKQYKENLYLRPKSTPTQDKYTINAYAPSSFKDDATATAVITAKNIHLLRTNMTCSPCIFTISKSQASAGDVVDITIRNGSEVAKGSVTLQSGVYTYNVNCLPAFVPLDPSLKEEIVIIPDPNL